MLGLGKATICVALVAAVFCLQARGPALGEPGMDFSEDPRIQQIAEAYALDAVDFARENMKVDLDWTDESVQRLESILDIFHRELATERPSDETVATFSKMWGSYLGEVYRKNHGGTWGMVTHEGRSFPGFRSSSGSLFWPWGRVENRLRKGTEDNVWHYYRSLTSGGEP